MLIVALAIVLTTEAPAPNVTVREERGVYSVSAQFVVPQSPGVVLAVLTDYEQIPRFLPDIKVSIVRERTAGRVVVEQEAVSRMMMFSKRVHLMLEITADGSETLRFRDRCGLSFTQYDGAWRLSAQPGGGTAIVYELTAKPAFDVPEFILRRLLKRDSVQMIDRLAREMAARAASSTIGAGAAQECVLSSSPSTPTTRSGTTSAATATRATSSAGC
jgi:ribosome-associated toxin RatA of RatAB toxin-antitoxin module